MRVSKADLATLQRVRTCLTQAASRGEDPALALEREGLLWFPQRYRESVAASLVTTATMLDEMTIKQLASDQQTRMPTSPLDTKRMTVSWLKLWADRVLEGDEK